MMKENKIKLAGIATVLGCVLFSSWLFYLLITGQSGYFYGIPALCMWIVLSLYFINEVKKEFKRLNKTIGD